MPRSMIGKKKSSKVAKNEAIKINHEAVVMLVKSFIKYKESGGDGALYAQFVSSSTETIKTSDNTVSHTHTTPDHTHATPDHTHNTPDHTHALSFGIHEEANSPTINVYIDDGAGYGASIGAYNSDQTDIDITSEISGSGWKSIKFTTSQRCRIACIIEIKLDISA